VTVNLDDGWTVRTFAAAIPTGMLDDSGALILLIAVSRSVS